MVTQADHLGALLKALRERAGLSLEAVRREIDRSVSYSYWLETNWSAPSAALLQQMLDLYGATNEERLLAYRLRGSAPSRPRKHTGEMEGDAAEDSDTDEVTEEGQALTRLHAKGAA